MKKLLLVITSIFFLSDSTDPSYMAMCTIKNGTAYGSIHNKGDGFSINGFVSFHFYDCEGELIDSEDEYEYEYVSRKSTEEIEKTSAPSDACSCIFDIKKAIKSSKKEVSNPPKYRKYLTKCELADGRAKGIVINNKNSFTIDGYVCFYFYDCDQNLIDTEDEYEYEYVSRESTEEIEETNAPSDACNCTFEIKDAIKKD